MVTTTQLERLRSLAKHKGFTLELADDGALTMTRDGKATTVFTAHEAYRHMRSSKLTKEEQRALYVLLYGPGVVR